MIHPDCLDEEHRAAQQTEKWSANLYLLSREISRNQFESFISQNRLSHTASSFQGYQDYVVPDFSQFAISGMGAESDRSFFKEHFTKFHLLSKNSLSAYEKCREKLLWGYDSNFPHGAWVEKTEIISSQVVNGNINALSV